jgi:large subunit ribosomal protein L13
MIIDGDGAVLGRLASQAAKAALEGENVNVINAEKIVIVGDRNVIIKKYMGRIELGTMSKGPFIHRTVEGIVKRAIRGMLKRKSVRGMDALRHVKVFRGMPPDLNDNEKISVSHFRTDKPVHRMSIGDLSNVIKYQG